MKNFLLLLLFISIAIQTNGQQLSDLENQHQKLAQESELQRKDKMGISRNLFELDSIYLYTGLEYNLDRKWLYYDYNFANNFTYYEDFIYENMEWVPWFVRNRTFNADGSVNSFLSQRYENGEWFNSSKAIFEYNQGGFETLEDREQWSTDLQEWGPFARFERTYNADNTLLMVVYHSRDLSGTILELRYINTYTNVDNVITEWVRENYNNGVVHSKEKTEVFLNADNDRDSTYTYEWDYYTSTWNLKSRYIYPADRNAPVRNYQTDLYQEMTDSWDPLFLSVYTDYTDIGEIQYWDRMRSDEGEKEFYLSSRREYFWSGNPLDVENPTDNEIDMIIANPFEGNPEITINGIKKSTTVLIYDLSGKIMFTKDLDQSDTFTLDKVLPNGTYILNLIQANEVVGAKKIVKIR